MTQPLDVLAVMAHPDDAEIFCGGALAKSAEAGERTGILDLTAGEAGSRGTRESREREAAAAAEILGLAERRCAGLPDASLANDREARATVAQMLRELRPRVVVTHWPEARHPDHRAAAHLARDAAFLAGLRNFPDYGAGRAHRPDKVVYALAFAEEEVKATFVIDISDQIDRKMEALAAYGSQFQNKSGIGEVFPAGDRPVLEQIRSVHRHYGSLIRRRYGEPYYTRETTTLDTLGSASVSTF